MSHLLKWGAALLLLVLTFSCRKANRTVAITEPVSQQVLDKIYSLGFSNKNVARHSEGYLVEGDIIVTEENLQQQPVLKGMRVGQEEQYRVSNLVTGLPRVISIRVSSSLPTSYFTATNTAIARFNAQGLQLTFVRVTTGGNIIISPAPAGATYTGSAGFPSGGNPYSSILLNTSILNAWNNNTVATIIAHNIGHCIGFAHTDITDPTYSCGAGASIPPIITAIHIPGTPSVPAVPGSWMLACISNGVNRPFVSSDILALNYLY